MKVNPETYEGLTRPAYVLEEKRLRRNLALIRDVAERSGVEIILAFKAYALWKTFPIFREYISSTTASSLSEARLAYEEFGAQAHTYSPAYTDYEIDDIARMSSHLTFNSLSQYERYHNRAKTVNPYLKLGVRVNPEYFYRFKNMIENSSLEVFNGVTLLPLGWDAGEVTPDAAVFGTYSLKLEPRSNS